MHHSSSPQPSVSSVRESRSLAEIFGVDEEHAMLRCIHLTELLLTVGKLGCRVFIEFDGSQYPFEVSNPTIPI